MKLIAMKGHSGCGKSTLARAISKELGWPLIDKDDVKDLLGDITHAGPLSYQVMFRVTRRQLLQGLNVICDSPLTGYISYRRAQSIATEAQASLAIIECRCSDEELWSQRINQRKTLGLPSHHQTDWESFQQFRHQSSNEDYPITHPHLILDTAQPFQECLAAVLKWLEEIE